MNPFKKIGHALKVGGKFAWKSYNRPEGQQLVSIFLPMTGPMGLAVKYGVGVTQNILTNIGENKKREQAKMLIISEFPEAANNMKMLNFMIEAKLQELAGNLSID